MIDRSVIGLIRLDQRVANERRRSCAVANGSIGEAIAKHHYQLDELFNASEEVHDGRKGKLLVQIKATQRFRIGISSEPQHLLVIKLLQNGGFEEVFNGPGSLVWQRVSHKKLPKNGQYQITISILKELMKDVPEEERLSKAET